MSRVTSRDELHLWGVEEWLLSPPLHKLASGHWSWLAGSTCGQPARTWVLGLEAVRATRTSHTARHSLCAGLVGVGCLPLSAVNPFPTHFTISERRKPTPAASGRRKLGPMKSALGTKTLGGAYVSCQTSLAAGGPGAGGWRPRHATHRPPLGDRINTVSTYRINTLNRPYQQRINSVSTPHLDMLWG